MRKSTLLFLVSLLIGYFYAIPALAQKTDVYEITTLNAIIPDFQVNENTGPNGAPQASASIATDGNENYIITWADWRNGDGDIYAQRFSSDGTTLGSNFKVSDGTGSTTQSRPSVAADSSGNFIISWNDSRNGDLDIYAQLYSSGGTALGNNFKVNDDTGSAGQYNPSIAADGNGNFIVTWRDPRHGDFDIYAQRYSSHGTALGSNFKVNDDTENATQSLTSIAADGSGNFIITWRDKRNGCCDDIYAQRYSSDGTAVGSNFMVNDDTGVAYQRHPSIATDGSGNFIIAWGDRRNGDSDIYAQRYSSDGIEIGSNFKVSDDTPYASQPSIAADGSGNFMITWRDTRNGDFAIFAQRYTSDGTAVGGNFKVNNDTLIAILPSIAADGSGDFIITWHDCCDSDPDIYAQRYSGDGTVVGSKFKVNDDTASASQDDPSIATDGSGNFISTWYDPGGVYAQRYSSDGTPVGSNFKVSDIESSYPSIAADGSGNFIITWRIIHHAESEAEFGNYDIYAQRYSSDGTAVGSNFKVNDDTGSADQWPPAIAADGIGNYIITWHDNRNGDVAIYAQRYSSDGSAVGSNFKVSDDTEYPSSPAIAADGIGNYIITWCDNRNGDSDIYAQGYSSDGTAMRGNFKVSDDTESAIQSYPSIATDGSENFIIAWQDSRNDDSDIYAQRYSNNGISIANNFKVSDDTEPATQANPSIAADSSGSFIITWDDTRNGASDIYAQRYASDGTAVGGNFRLTNTSDKIQISPEVKLWNSRIYTTWTDNRVGGTGFDIWANVLEWDNPVGIRNDEPFQIPSAYRLRQNYPNPFNPSTTIRYSVEQPDFVQLSVYDELGRLVRTLVNERKADGEYSIIWDGKNEKGVLVSTGTYFYTLKLRRRTIIAKRMLLLR